MEDIERIIRRGLLELLTARARETWRSEDAVQAAILGVLEAMAEGKTDEASIWLTMQESVRAAMKEIWSSGVSLSFLKEVGFEPVRSMKDSL